MKGNCRHIIEEEDKEEGGGVFLYNDQDGYYDQTFETKEELNDFIQELVDMGKKVFGD